MVDMLRAAAKLNRRVRRREVHHRMNAKAMSKATRLPTTAPAIAPLWMPLCELGTADVADAGRELATGAAELDDVGAGRTEENVEDTAEVAVADAAEATLLVVTGAALKLPAIVPIPAMQSPKVKLRGSRAVTCTKPPLPPLVAVVVSMLPFISVNPMPIR